MKQKINKQGVAVFLKAGFFTAAGISLIVIGYLATGYFFH